jgi:hypothetical protein
MITDFKVIQIAIAYGAIISNEPACTLLCLTQSDEIWCKEFSPTGETDWCAMEKPPTRGNVLGRVLVYQLIDSLARRPICGVERID